MQSATARVRNVFGGAETFEANASVGTKTRRSIQASLSAPVTSTLRTRGDLSIFALDRDYTTYASCTEAVRGVKAGLKVSLSKTWKMLELSVLVNGSMVKYGPVNTN